MPASDAGCSPQFTQRGETWSAAFFVSMARREVSQPPIKLSFDLTLASPRHVTQTLNLCGYFGMGSSPGKGARWAINGTGILNARTARPSPTFVGPSSVRAEVERLLLIVMVRLRRVR
jgi:hypothetical protein